MKHPDGRPWSEKAPIILPDTTLKARFLNDILTDEDYCQITELIDKDEAELPIERHPFKSFGRCPKCHKNINIRCAEKFCMHCGKKVDWSVEA